MMTALFVDSKDSELLESKSLESPSLKVFPKVRTGMISLLTTTKVTLILVVKVKPMMQERKISGSMRKKK